MLALRPQYRDAGTERHARQMLVRWLVPRPRAHVMHPAVLTLAPSRFANLDPPITILADSSSRVAEMICSAADAVATVVGTHAFDLGGHAVIGRGVVGNCHRASWGLREL